MEILTCRALGFTYNGAKNPVLQGLDFTLRHGDFVLLMGANGSGKSTLLRLLKKEIAPYGRQEGNIFFRGRPSEEISEGESVRSIGYVGSDCMLTSEYVSSQLAFILESLNTAPDIIRLKTAEICAEFGLEGLFSKPIDKLSGGERQKVALASVLIAEPELLLLDEPISALDPVSAADFLALLQKHCRRNNMTVLLAEHSFREILPFCNRLLYLKNGRLVLFDEVQSACRRLFEDNDEIFSALLDSVQLFHMLDGKGNLPLQAAELQTFLQQYLPSAPPQKSQMASTAADLSEAILSVRDLTHRYERSSENTLQGLSLKLKKGCCTALIGANGSGKSTLLRLMAGIIKPLDGKIKCSGGICLLPQQAGDIFTHGSLREELNAAAPESEWQPLVQRFKLTELLESHYLDLSGGELQKAALIRLLLKRPALLLLDEPTVGLDFQAARELAELLKSLAAEGISICFATHDMDFCAAAADATALLFNKEIACQMPAKEFLLQGSYYTTQVAAATRRLSPCLDREELLTLINAQNGS